MSRVTCRLLDSAFHEDSQCAAQTMLNSRLWMFAHLNLGAELHDRILQVECGLPAPLELLSN